MSKSCLRLDLRRPLKDGTYPVQVKVGYGTNLYLATGVYLKPEDWDDRLQVCTGKSARKINSILGTLLLQVTNRVLDLRGSGQFSQLTTAQLRQMLTNLELSAPTVGVPSVGDYIDRVRDLKTPNTQVSYVTTKNRLALYCDPDTLRVIARQDPSALAPLAPIRTGSRIKFPRLRFLSWYFGETYRGDTRLNAFYLAKNSQSVGDRP